MMARLHREGPASHEPLTAKTTAKTWWCLSRHADHVADVGADIGYYALLASKAAPAATVHHYGEVLASAKSDAELSTLAALIERMDWPGYTSPTTMDAG